MGSVPSGWTSGGVRTRLHRIPADVPDGAHTVRPSMRLLVDLNDAGAEQALTLLVLAVQSLDQLSAGPPTLIIGVMPVAQHELAARGGMVPDAPASRLVTVEFLHQLVYACA